MKIFAKIRGIYAAIVIIFFVTLNIFTFLIFPKKYYKAIKKFYRDTDEDGNKIAEDYYEEATSGDYDHLIQTTLKYCNVT